MSDESEWDKAIRTASELVRPKPIKADPDSFDRLAHSVSTSDANAILKLLGYGPNRWQDISTAPKDGTPFLCGWWNNDRTYWWTCKAHWANGAVDGGWDGAREPFAIHPTHWMPLPAAPAAAAHNVGEAT